MADQNDPKIIIDDDWKSQVEQEKEQLKQQEQTADEPADPQQDYELPPASMSVLISTLATQAMGCLGMFPDPGSGQINVDRRMAKHFIDTLAVLDEKTKGNLSEQEEPMLRDTLHQLRMAFVASGNADSSTAGDAAESTDSADQAAPAPKSTIELP